MTNNKEYTNKYYATHRDRILSNAKKWRSENRDKIKQRSRKAQRKWDRSHPEVLREMARRAYSKNPEARRAHTREWRLQNQDKVKQYEVSRSLIPEFRLVRACRTRLLSFLRGKNNTDRSRKMMGCSVGFLRNHIESTWQSGWSWQNHGTAWHIDHIVPLSWFPLTDEWLSVAFHWTNLHAMSREENHKKGARRAG